LCFIKKTGNYEKTKQTLKPQTPKIVDEHSASLHVCGYSNSCAFCASPSPSPLMACQADYECPPTLWKDVSRWLGESEKKYSAQ
jgi:hypothetical protein